MGGCCSAPKSRYDESYHTTAASTSANLSSAPSSSQGHRPPTYSLAQIRHATNNFYPGYEIGEGGSCRVYRGTLQNMDVAIKRFTDTSDESFNSELEILTEIYSSNLRSSRLVGFLGSCSEANERILVFEFMANGTLYNMLHNRSDDFSLSYRQRLVIAQNIANGVSDLHKKRTLHCDIKSMNVLLDQNYGAKICDFGFAIKLPQGSDFVATGNMLRYTEGYIDPEFFNDGLLSEKTDVYSFGKLLIELFTGKKATSVMPDWYFGGSMQKNKEIITTKIRKICDRRLKYTAALQRTFVEAIFLAIDCISADPDARPSMTQASNTLARILERYDELSE
ncbi:hypothetical protein CCACVL1_10127 [Corchorus capsularis]|uniref:Protein kinase domain-containing protein n=1 Tax=Corchorus capsularis TaxID=210143 RepID=A0A1R3ISG3_COCAP|nr:hypothetical protein CCACVL1_10127 [Corchorus capsularis]